LGCIFDVKSTPSYCNNCDTMGNWDRTCLSANGIDR
jgi:hypothetical protein